MARLTRGKDSSLFNVQIQWGLLLSPILPAPKHILETFTPVLEIYVNGTSGVEILFFLTDRHYDNNLILHQ